MMAAMTVTVKIATESRGNSGMTFPSDISKVNNFDMIFSDLFPVWYENVMFALMIPDEIAVYKIPELGPTIVMLSPGLRLALNIAKQLIA